MNMQEKLFQSRQIYDLMYSTVSFVEPLSCHNQYRLASTKVQILTQLLLQKYKHWHSTDTAVQEIFDQDESCDFETFLELTEEVLQEMGVDNFGVRYPVYWF